MRSHGEKGTCGGKSVKRYDSLKTLIYESTITKPLIRDLNRASKLKESKASWKIPEKSFRR